MFCDVKLNLRVRCTVDFADMADNLVDGEDLDVILDLPENDCLDDDQDIQGAFLIAAEEACFLFTIKFTVDLAILLSDL